MEQSFASRVLEFRKHKGLSQQAFAERCQLEQGNISQMEKGTEPKQSNVSKLVAGFPDLNPEWLLLGTGTMLRDGRALASVAHGRTHGEARTAVQAPEPAGPLTVAYPTPEEYRSLQEENRKLREQLAAKDGKLSAVEEERVWLRTELIKKPEASADAASLFDTVDEIAHEYRIAPMELPEIQRFVPRPAPRMVIQGLRQGAA